jgi:hypothetical protein
MQQRIRKENDRARGIENRKDEPVDGVGARTGKTSQRDGPEAGCFRTERTARLANAEGKPSQTSREASRLDLPAPNADGNRRGR